MGRISAVLFDFGDTVMHQTSYDALAGDAYLFSIARNQRGVAFEEFEECVRRVGKGIQEKNNPSCLEHSWKCFNALVSRRLGLVYPDGIDIELEFWNRVEKFEAAPGIEDVLRYLGAKGEAAGIDSNCAYSGSILDRELEKHGLRTYFDFVLSSADFGIRKPHPLLFETAAGILGKACGEIAFIGDRVEFDVSGSAGAGMVPILYTGNRKESLPYECAAIGQWPELPALLDSMMA